MIRFDKIFNQEPLMVFNDFELRSRRTFKNLAPMILETYNEIFLKEDGTFNEDLSVIMFNLLNIKSELEYINARLEPTEAELNAMSPEEREEAERKIAEGNWNVTTYDEFLEMLDSLVGNIKLDDDGLPVKVDIKVDESLGNEMKDSLLLKTINDFVEKNYALNLDEATEKDIKRKKKINEELQFTDYHAKTLIKTAYLYRIVIPVISSYFMLNKDQFPKNDEQLESSEYEDMEFNEIFISLFAHLFEKYAGRRANAIRNKLFKLILSRIGGRLYSDRRFWNIAKNQGITKDTVSLDIYKKLLTNSVPKLSINPEHNTVSFLLSVIGNQIDYLFQDKFKHKISTIGNTQEKYSDSDEVSEFERLEMMMLKNDEGQFLIRKLSIEENFDKIEEFMGVTVSEEEVIEYQSIISRHLIQERIVSALTFKYFKDEMAVKLLDFRQYVKLVLIVRKYLLKNKFVYLPEILISRVEKHKERDLISGSRIRPWIESSKKYKDLFNNKFNMFGDKLQRPISALIATIYSSTFINPQGENVLDQDVKVDKVAEEILDAMYLV